MLFVGVLFVLVNATFYLAINMMNVAAAITLEYTSPFSVLVLSAIFGGRRVTLRDAGIVALSLTGCFLITGGDGEWVNISDGLLVGLACGLSFVIFNMVCSAYKKRGIEVLPLTSWSFAISAVIWGAALSFLTLHMINPTPQLIAYVGFIAIVATIFPYWLLLFGLRHVDVLPAAVIGLFDLVAAGLIAYLLLGETMALPNVIGIALVAVAVILITLAERKTVEASA